MNHTPLDGRFRKGYTKAANKDGNVQKSIKVLARQANLLATLFAWRNTFARGLLHMCVCVMCQICVANHFSGRNACATSVFQQVPDSMVFGEEASKNIYFTRIKVGEI